MPSHKLSTSDARTAFEGAGARAADYCRVGPPTATERKNRHRKGYYYVYEGWFDPKRIFSEMADLAQAAFNLDIDKPYISKLMTDYHFSSRTTRSVQSYRFEESFVEECVEFLTEARSELKKLPALSYANAVDQIGLWNSPSVLRSYAPVGW
jgi:hypothetical protein